MATLLTMPSLSPTMETGVISAWRKQVGDTVEPGEVLAEVETDKAIMDFEAADEGVLREILAEPGQELPVGEPIAILGESAEEDISAVLEEARAARGGAPAPAAEQPAGEKPAAEQPAGEKPAAEAPTQPEGPPPAAAPAGPQGRVRISPYGRKLAREHNIDYRQLAGSGPAGRIVARDVEQAIAAGGAPAAAAAGRPGLAVVSAGEAYEDLPLGMMRRAIARKMQESKQTVPHFQATRKVRMERMLSMREQLKADFPDIRVSINDFIVKACATALRFHPMVNSQYLGDKIRRFHTVDVSVAVATDEGLLTPVIRNADRKGVRQIAEEVRELAGRAREKRLAPEEYTGGTFTVSNLGMYEMDEFNGIINTPQACLLAVSSVVKEPVVEDDAIVVGHTMHMTLSSDHRIVDGATAAEFLRTLTRILQNPLSLVL